MGLVEATIAGDAGVGYRLARGTYSYPCLRRLR
jgi:hypothetical protein